ncbi:Peptidyl-tRNA hydrolase ict1, mitochondrial [Blyttiomyces sp. JEL0837]|nr:Peptidyl-tRNA hydrolase ict1, mitochondrial [Blyttiomyces sp. JEL0837]
MLTSYRLLPRSSITHFHAVRNFSGSVRLHSAEVTTFLETFRPNSIPRDQLEIQFSRSSGPGGQNVNKVNSKVDLRLDVEQADWIPLKVRNRIAIDNANRMNRKGQLIVTSDRHRTQAQNLEDCFEKLYDTVMAAAQAEVPKVVSEETLKKIEEFKLEENKRKKFAKEKRSRAKSERRFRDDY